jgi:hypothetical protein
MGLYNIVRKTSYENHGFILQVRVQDPSHGDILFTTGRVNWITASSKFLKIP